ncbi:MAG TPA: hypothetical protein VF520_16335 [Thermoleophilaceae bacterium]|jgi:hypothetical protein
MTLEQRAAAAAAEAKRAEEAGDRWAAHEAWRRYQRIVDATRPPGELVERAKRLRRLAASVRLLDEPAG